MLKGVSTPPANRQTFGTSEDRKLTSLQEATRYGHSWESMDSASASTRDLADRMLALEAAEHSEARETGALAVWVCQKLKASLTRFAGIEGFTALMRRALALARTEVPSLQAVSVKPDGTVEGLEGVSAEATVALIAQLLALLNLFIGDALTLRLVRDAWPELSDGKQATGIGN